jgi:RHS repeat-associated protein
LPNGQVTGTKVKVLGTSNYITTTNYYDDHYRVLESLKNLYDDSNGSEIISNRYNFIGNVTHTKQSQTFSTHTTAVDKYFTYDHSGRLLTTESEINGNNRLTVAQLTYNELGQLTKKGLNKISSSYLQEVDYGYNIRGWLSTINDPDNLGSNLFSMKLLYENPGTLTNLTKENQYNGNISGVIWNRKTGPGTTLKSAYTFRYDAINRITNNYYGEGSSLTNSEKFREYDYSYDSNGNILALKRNDGNGTGTQIDNLSYAYLSTLSNQLAAVTDGSSNTSGFNDGNTSGNDYSYDSNGNLTKDLNKGFGTIAYNCLNLPQSISKDANNSITYYYDAMGTKLKQVVLSSGNPTSRYYYDGFEYLSNKTLSLIHMDEGVINRDSTGTFAYEYFIKDHLGNTRVSFENSSGTALITQSIDYYPFGLQFVPVNQGGTNKYLYNGKEYQDGLGLDWYDYGARFYDPQIGRFTTIDGLAEKFAFMTPFQYASNNPIKNIDLDGLEGVAPPPPGEELEFNREEFEAEGMESESGLRSIEEDNPVSMAELLKNAEAFVKNASFVEEPLEGPVANPKTSTIDPNKSVIESIPKGAGLRLLENKKQGKDFEGTVTNSLKETGHTNIAEQVTVKPNVQGAKNVRLDNVSTKQGAIKLTDAKSSSGAGMTKNQKPGYPAIGKYGGTVVGNKGAAQGYPAGTKIPPTKVDIIRPNDLHTP